MKRKRIFMIILLIVWAGFIFYMSSKPAKDSLKYNRKIVSEINISFGIDLNKLYGEETVTHYVRKTAHVIEYIVLSAVLYNILKTSKIKNKISITLIICLLYAILDEVHQMFVPGRGPMIRDVVIDIMGSAAYIIVVKIIGLRRSINRSYRGI